MTRTAVLFVICAVAYPAAAQYPAPPKGDYLLGGLVEYEFHQKAKSGIDSQVQDRRETVSLRWDSNGNWAKEAVPQTGSTFPQTLTVFFDGAAFNRIAAPDGWQTTLLPANQATGPNSDWFTVVPHPTVVLGQAPRGAKQVDTHVFVGAKGERLKFFHDKDGKLTSAEVSYKGKVGTVFRFGSPITVQTPSGSFEVAGSCAATIPQNDSFTTEHKVRSVRVASRQDVSKDGASWLQPNQPVIDGRVRSKAVVVWSYDELQTLAKTGVRLTPANLLPYSEKRGAKTQEYTEREQARDTQVRQDQDRRLASVLGASAIAGVLAAGIVLWIVRANKSR